MLKTDTIEYKDTNKKQTASQVAYKNLVQHVTQRVDLGEIAFHGWRETLKYPITLLYFLTPSMLDLI